VTTKSKQRAVIEIIREFCAPTTFKKDPKNPGGWLPADFETTRIGATFEAMGDLHGNGPMSVVLIAQFVEFLGMVDIDSGKPTPADGALKHPIMSNGVFDLKWPNYHYEFGRRNLPVFSTLKSQQDVTLRSGQSVLLALKETADTKPFQDSLSGKHVIVIVTAQLVEGLGNGRYRLR
jgi:hypothetical protein